MTWNIAHNTLKVFFARSLSTFLLFLTGVFIAKIFGAQGFGVYELFVAIVNFTVLFGGLGIGSASIYLLNRERENPKQLLTNVLIIGFVWGIFLALAVAIFLPKVSFSAFDFSEHFFFYAAVGIFLVLLETYLFPFLLASFQIMRWSLFFILHAILILVGTIAFVALGGLTGALFAILGGNFVVLVLLLLSLLRRGVFLRFSMNLFTKQLRIGLFSYFGDIFQPATFRFNLFFASLFLPLTSIGHYALTLAVANILFLVPYAFQQILYPTWSSIEKRFVDANTLPMARQSLILGAIGALSLFGVARFFLIPFVYGEAFAPALFPLAILLPGSVFMIFASIFFNNFFSKGKAYLTTYILLAVFGLNLVLNLLFLPTWGVVGATLAISLSYFVGALLAVMVFSRISGYQLSEILRFRSSDVRDLVRKFWEFIPKIPQKNKELSPNFKEKKIRVCYLASADISLRFFLLPQLKYLQSQKFEVWGVSSSGKWIGDLKKEGIKVKTVPIKRRIFTPFADLRVLVSLFIFFLKERFQIVHTHTLKASFLGNLAAFFARVPIRVYTVHGFDFQELSSFWKRKLFELVERIIAKLVHLAFSINRVDINVALKKGIYQPGEIVYLGDGVDLHRFDPKRFSERFIQEKKKELGIPLSAKVVGIVARLVKEKGFLELFTAFKNILKSMPDVMLVAIGGEEPDKEDAISPEVVTQYGIEKNVLFLGERTDMPELYAIMDVFVLPTHREGLGLVLLEASAMEKPVVATTARGCKEAVDDGITGILVPIGDSEKLAKAILTLLLNPDLAQKMGKAGRKKVEQEFDEEILFGRIKKEYGRLLKEKLGYE